MKIKYYIGKIRTTKEAAAFILNHRLEAERITVDTFEYPVTIPLDKAVVFDDGDRNRTIIDTTQGVYETTSKDVAEVIELVATCKLPVSDITLSTEEFNTGHGGTGTMLRATISNGKNPE